VFHPFGTQLYNVIWDNCNQKVKVLFFLLQKDQSLFGLVAIDIPVFVFKAMTPRSKLGPLGYSFGLNSNGFTIWHPELFAVANYLEDSGKLIEF